MKVYEDVASSALGELDLKTAAVNLGHDRPAGGRRGLELHGVPRAARKRRGETAVEEMRVAALSLQFARFPYPEEAWRIDFKAQPGVDRRLIDELATGRFA
ncbi:MAG: hypothetical protein IPJ30_02440 [Acidobacteria bacterium]|nr:hypothetical protein [Acidobacteriota bacterium]